ncbi:putative secreted protein (Por secretion system target) [Dinghuibacter silviterrae]|uniref:Putative secreted protein (Por secretion system target) n=2 Tax=Dinghuibacter silviterrae TaxID=1539049 RepID=A0A4V3GKZ3_9BACT|nr:putative secreted protein (Por secretion system target) [Dinghuibacter silviterrae]
MTNKTALNRASTLARQEEDRSYNLAIRLAAQKRWPLIIHGRQGKYAVLSGVDEAGGPIYKVVDNLSSAQTVSTTALWPGGSTGLSLSGNATNLKGRLAIWDGGAVRGTHVELAGRVIQKDGATTLDDHATHTSGTMIATGVNPQAKGMSFQAPELDAYDFNNDVSEMATAAPNLYLSNHSYGTIAGWYLNTDNNHWEWYGNSGDTVDYKFGYYDFYTMMRDSIAYNAPDYLMVQAASNNRGETGPAVDSNYYPVNSNGVEESPVARPANLSSNAYFHTIPTYGNAKDVLTVGAVEPIPGGYNSASDVVMTYFSSWGPTTDGRIKPDIVADGDGVLSSISTSDYAYDTYAGTSMATPNVTGSLLLLQQYYTQNHHDTAMRSATLKALAIHTADQAGTSPGPNYIYGWGLLDTKTAVGVIKSSLTDGSQQILESSLVNGTTDTLRIPVVASGKGTLKATIVWTDPPGTVNSTNLFSTTPILVNDLDLRIIKGSTTYLPWVLTPSSPATAATKGDNKLDNVEKVELDSVVPGATYTIQVTHKGTLARGQQAFSLVYSGVGGSAYCTSAPTSSTGTRIDSVSLGGVHNKNAAGCTTYSDFTSLQANVSGAQTVPFYVGLSSCDASANSRVVKIYIDYNNDNTFTDGGDLVATSPVLAGGTTSWTGSFTTPATLTAGGTTRMRIVTEEVTDTSLVKPCGSYSNGETQDYSVLFVKPAKDLSIYNMVDPLNPACADSTQIVTLTIHNNGTATQAGFPVTATVMNGNTVVATLTGTYPDTIGAGANIAYALPGNFNSIPGTTYSIKASVNLTGDQNTANDTATFSFTVSPAATNPSTGTATICGTGASTANLKVNGADSSNSYFWYTTATGGSPIASGYNTTTTTIPSNNTFYFSSGGSGSFGPATKTTLDTAGGYNAFYGNWVSYHAAVPVTLESARFYTKYHGTIAFVVADVDQSTITSSGAFSYLPYTTTTVHVYATAPHTEKPHSDGSTQTDDPSDTGAVFYLNIPLPAGDHDIIIESLDSATIFRNTGVPSTNTYPFGSTNLFAWTGNSAGVTAGSLGTLYKSYFYFFYDAKIKTTDCSATGARTQVTAVTAPNPVITENGDSLISSAASGNQWFLGGVILSGATNPIYIASKSGVYDDEVTDSATGCVLTSNSINYVLTAVDTVSAPQGLKIYPDPTPTGLVNVTFTVTNSADLTFEVYNVLGELVSKQVYPSYIGAYSGQINLKGYADGVYILKITHGDNVTIRKILLQQQ